MPVTGSNNKKSYRNLSIQQQLGGQIFSMTEPKHLVVEIDTCFTKPIPSQENISAESCFEADGLTVTHNETLLRTYITSELDLVTVVPNSALEQMNRHFSEQKYLIYTPLQRVVEYVRKRQAMTMAIWFSQHNTYIAIGEKRTLKYAEVFPITSDNDLLYCLSVIDNDFGVLKSANVILLGKNTQARLKFLKKYIKNCKCE